MTSGSEVMQTTSGSEAEGTSLEASGPYPCETDTTYPREVDTMYPQETDTMYPCETDELYAELLDRCTLINGHMIWNLKQSTFTYYGKRYSARHLLWTWTNGPSSRPIVNLCGESKCIEPSHQAQRNGPHPKSIPQNVGQVRNGRNRTGFPNVKVYYGVRGTKYRAQVRVDGVRHYGPRRESAELASTDAIGLKWGLDIEY